jgi:trimeric autotransporter adhesin
MPTQVQFRRGNTTATSTFTGANGEISIDTDKKALVIHDGVTAGGFPVLTADNSILTGNTSVVRLAVSNSLSVGTNKFIANTSAVVIGAPLTANGSTGSSGQVLTSNGATGAPYWVDNEATTPATYVQNTDSRTLSGNLVISGTYFNPSANTILLGNATSRWVVSANSGDFTGTVTGTVANMSTSVNSSLLTVGSDFIANTTGVYHTGIVNAASINVGGGGFIANSTSVVIADPLTANGTTGTAGQVLASNGATGAPYWADNEASTPATYVQNTDSRTLSGNLVISGTSFTPSSNTVLLGNSTQRWVVSANTGDFTGTVTGTVANMSTSVNSALLTVGSNFIANSTAIVGTGYANISTSVNSALLTVGTSFIANTTGAYHTGVVNADSHTTSGFVANATGIIPTSNTISLGSSTGRFVLSANTGDFSGAITSSGGVNPASNTTGTALGSATARFVLNANSGNFTANIAMNSNYITGLSDPSNAQDAATKAYVDTFQQGLHVHASVAAATSNTLAILSGGSVTYNNETAGVGATLTLGTALTTLDGYSLVNDDRVMVKNEANTAHNGIYTRTSSTILTRATDFDTGAEVAGGDFVFVTNGTLYNSTGWVQIDEVTTIGTDAILFQQFSGQGTFTAGQYLYLTGSQFNANASSSSTASVLIARDASQNFAANTATLNSVSATTGTFSGAVSGITTLAAGNTTVTGFVNATSTIQGGSSLTIAGAASGITTLAAGNTTITGFANASVSVNSALLTVGTSFIANTTGAYHTGIVNAASVTVGSNFIANSTAIVGTGFANISTSVNSALLTVGSSFIANTTGVYHTGLVNAASINIGGSGFIANSTAIVLADPVTANGTTGTAGQVLASNGSTGSPYWVTAGGGSTAADDTSTNGTRYVLFANQTTGTISTAYVSSTKLTYNPSTGTLTSTVVTASSDEKLKTNIHTISDPIDVISNLRGVSFDRKDTGLKDFGVIAQEIEQVIPEVVHIDNDGFRSVSYNSIIGFLIEGMKQQQSKIDDLEEKIQKLLD